MSWYQVPGVRLSYHAISKWLCGYDMLLKYHDTDKVYIYIYICTTTTYSLCSLR